MWRFGHIPERFELPDNPISPVKVILLTLWQKEKLWGQKLLKQALAATMFISACFSSFAQDVDGISLWDQYTKEQLIQRYGQPVSYESQEGDSPEDGLIEVIKFKDVFFYLVNLKNNL